MATVDGAYGGGGGVGGKSRRKPFRRSEAGSTPYERPASAQRNVRVGGHGERNGGWISKIIDPATRLISSGASMVFSSVFGKLHGAPTTTTTITLPAIHEIEEDHQVTNLNFEEYVPDEIPGKPSPEGVLDVKNTENSDTSISKLEQLLKQKTFTRAEFDRLSDYMRSRTIGLSEENEIQRTEPSTSQPKSLFCKQEKNVGLRENGSDFPKLFGSISRPDANINNGVLQVPDEDFASPTQLAKAFMGSRSSQLTLPPSALRHTSLRKFANLPSTGQITLTPHSSNGLTTPKPTVRFSGQPENSYRTSRTHGRSAMYRMSRSPYFKAQTMGSFQGIRPYMEGNSVQSSSQQTPSISLSGGKQAVKKGSFLDKDSGSVGPIRRGRQKFNLGSSSKETGNFLTTQVGTSPQGSPASVRRLFSSNGLDHFTSQQEDAVDGVTKSSSANFTSVPQQSSVTAKKILQQLDYLAPSVKEKSPERKTDINDESPPKSTHNMLNGQPFKSGKNIDSSKVQIAEASSPKHNRTPDNVSHKQPLSGAEVLSEVGCSIKKTVVTAGNKSDARTSDLVFSSTTGVIPKKPFFQMLAPENSWEQDEDNSACGVEYSFQKSKLAIAEPHHFLAESTVPKKPSISSEKQLGLSSTLNGDDEIGIPDGSGSLLFSSTAEKSVPLETQASMKERSFAVSNPSAPIKEQSNAPPFGFSFKSAPNGIFSLTSSSFNNSTGPKFGANSKPKLGMSVSTDSNSTLATNQTVTLDHEKCKETEIIREPSVAAAPGLFAFSAPTKAPNNEPLKLISSVPAFPKSPGSDVLAGSTISVSESPSVLPFPLAPSFEHGSDVIAISTDSVTPLLTKCDTEDLKIKASKGPAFGVSSFSTKEPTPNHSSSVTSLFNFSFSAPSGATSISGQPGSQTLIFTQNSASHFGSSTPSSTSGLDNSSFNFTGSVFGSSTAGVKSDSVGLNSGSSNPPLTFASGLFNSNSKLEASSPGAGFSFGLSSTSSSPFSFTSVANATTSTSFSPPKSGFEIPAPVTFGSSMAQNDQMNEDNMVDDPVQSFRQPAPPAATPSISFGSPSPQPGSSIGFQFGTPPGSNFTQGQPPFQAPGNLEFNPGGNFSVGIGAGENKTNRRIVKVKRDKHRKR